MSDDFASESMRSFLERKLLETRTLLIYGRIDQSVAEDVTQKLLLLSATSNDPIKLFINSQGGHVESGDTIFDMIRFVKPRVKIIGTGWVASAGALIYSSVPLEDRYSLPNTRYMLHQPLGGVSGQASDIAIEALEIVKMRERLNKSFAQQTGQPLEKITKDTDRNFWMSAEEAKEYKLVGHIIQSIDAL
ncbi:ATP-dependent Clp protease proteolytic subunit [Myxococcota bacterium]|nr:ATP-dependent Clp protease proteolytic subunit [Myxococcota bacterium]